MQWTGLNSSYSVNLINSSSRRNSNGALIVLRLTSERMFVKLLYRYICLLQGTCISKSINGVDVLKMGFTRVASAMFFFLLEYIITCNEREQFPIRSRKNTGSRNIVRTLQCVDSLKCIYHLFGTCVL